MLYDYGCRSLNCAPQTNNPKGDDGVKLDLRPLLAGERLLSFDYELPLSVDPEDTSSFLYGVDFPSPMKVSGEITNTAGYMRMTLTLSVNYQAVCARCLKPLGGVFTLDLEKTVAPRNVLEGLSEDRLDDYLIIDDGFLDMDAPLLEEIEMAFPVRFLCKDDCRGLCQRCGKDLNEGDCDCQKGEIDPRLAPLAEILRKMQEEDSSEE